MKTLRFSAGVLCAWLVIGLAGCNRLESEWAHTRRVNSVRAYRQFLKEFPNSSYQAVALAQLKAAALREAKFLNSEDGFVQFATEFPDTSEAADALRQAAAIAYSGAKRRDTEEAYRAFSEKYPEFELAREAMEKAADIAHRRAISAGTAAAWQELVSRYPQSSLAPAAQLRVATLAAQARKRDDFNQQRDGSYEFACDATYSSKVDGHPLRIAASVTFHFRDRKVRGSYRGLMRKPGLNLDFDEPFEVESIEADRIVARFGRDKRRWILVRSGDVISGTEPVTQYFDAEFRLFDR